MTVKELTAKILELKLKGTSSLKEKLEIQKLQQKLSELTSHKK